LYTWKLGARGLFDYRHTDIMRIILADRDGDPDRMSSGSILTGERFHTFSELTFSGPGPGEFPDNLMRHGH